jgi:TonB family protein
VRTAKLMFVACIAGCASWQPPARVPVAPLPTPAQYSTAQCPALAPLSRHPPIYPREAVSARQNGWVMMSFDVTKHGQPHHIHVVDSSPPKTFDAAAVQSLEKWTYALPKEGEYRDCRQVLEFRIE